MLSDENRKLRQFKFTASMAPALMSGDDEMINELYERAIGERPEPEQTWPMLVGSVMEPYVIDWHEMKCGHELVERGTFVPHPDKVDVSATLDCFRPFDNTVIDAKCCNPYTKLDKIIEFYTPQIIVQMRCRGVSNGALLIMHGLAEPREYQVAFDEAYEAKLWEYIAAFQLCVATFTRPLPMQKVVPPDKWRSIDLDTLPHNQWPNWAEEMIEALKLWDANKDGAEVFGNAAKKAKELMPNDVRLVEWGGLGIARNRASALTIRRAG